MILTILILIGCTILGGLSLKLIPGMKQNMRLSLIFAGSYLFAITIIHIIPELFSISENPSTLLDCMC